MNKFSADRIFNGFQFADPDSVLITGEEGSIIDIIKISEAGDDIQVFNGIISPGLINCHCHLELSHLKGIIPEKKGLANFVTDVVQKRHLPEEMIFAAINSAEEEMLKNGIVAVGDICNNTLTIPQKKKGKIYYHNFIEASGFDPSITNERFERAKDLYNIYHTELVINGKLPGSVSIVPHAPYSVSDQLWTRIIEFPGNNLLTIHNQETLEENEWFISKTGNFTELYGKMNIDVSFYLPTGKTSIQSYLPKFRKNQAVILVHNVHTSEDDLAFAESNSINPQLFWCFCPNANEYISGVLPDINLFIKHQCNIVLGTDSLASNHQLNIIEEIKTIKKHFPAIELEIMFKWATSNGAKALNLENNLGSFEKFKKPGVILIAEDLSEVKRLL